MSRCLSRIIMPTIASGRHGVDVACQLDEDHDMPHRFETWTNTYVWQEGDPSAKVEKSGWCAHAAG